MPFYMQKSTSIRKTYVALIPLIQFVSGFVFSFTMKVSAKKIGKELVYTLGARFCITAGLALGLVNNTVKTLYSGLF